jgi:hypothetical protein
VPLILGATVGIGVDAATASLNVILTGAAPLASLPPLAGVTERTCSGALGLAAAAGVPGPADCPPCAARSLLAPGGARHRLVGLGRRRRGDDAARDGDRGRCARRSHDPPVPEQEPELHCALLLAVWARTEGGRRGGQASHGGRVTRAK